MLRLLTEHFPAAMFSLGIVAVILYFRVTGKLHSVVVCFFLFGLPRKYILGTTRAEQARKASGTGIVFGDEA